MPKPARGWTAPVRIRSWKRTTGGSFQTINSKAAKSRRIIWRANHRPRRGFEARTALFDYVAVPLGGQEPLNRPRRYYFTGFDARGFAGPALQTEKQNAPAQPGHHENTK